jgi:hypothetical protein
VFGEIKMKKFSFLVLMGFLSISAFAENGKWFDYGNGIINLNTVNMITPKEKRLYKV